MTRTREEILALLRPLKQEAARTYKVRDIALFGSVARGQQGAASDVDVLVDFADDADLFDQIGLSLMLEERLGCAVDVVPRRALRPEIADSVLGAAVAV
jgi:predicted nucleotidyltransferase